MVVNDLSLTILGLYTILQVSKLGRSPLKEVIQPHLPVRLPCYDFTPVISPTLGVSLF
jgi:hypothetical protein